MPNCTCEEDLKKDRKEKASLENGQLDDIELMKLVFEISREILENAPDKANCTDEDKAAYAELAALVENLRFTQEAAAN